MQKGVLVKDVNGNVVEKRVYAGDISNLDNRLKIEGIIYVIYDDTDPIFVSATLPVVPSTDAKIVALKTAVSAVAQKTSTPISLV